MSTADERRANAEATWDWYVAYREAGFSRRQAFQIVVASIGRTVVGGFPPEASEFMVKMSAMLDRNAAEDG